MPNHLPPDVPQSVIGIVFDSTGRLLLVKRRDVAIWVLPGGGIDPGETPAEACLREVFEETGLHVAIRRQIAIYTPINKLTYHTYVFECTPLQGELSKGDETRDVGFFDLTSLPKPFFFLHRQWLADAALNLTATIEKPIDQVTYWSFFCYLLRHPLQVIRFLLTLMGRPVNSKKSD
jgi:ADP-ribose pyrophosphatase YjhB (NUDIX family)